MSHVYVLLMLLAYAAVNFVRYRVVIDDCSCNRHDCDYYLELLIRRHPPIHRRLKLEFHRYLPICRKKNDITKKKIFGCNNYI